MLVLLTRTLDASYFHILYQKISFCESFEETFDRFVAVVSSVVYFVLTSAHILLLFSSFF